MQGVAKGGLDQMENVYASEDENVVKCEIPQGCPWDKGLAKWEKGD